MKGLLIIGMLLTLSTSAFTTSQQCTCSQLRSEGDCLKQLTLGCIWDSIKATCSNGNGSTPTPQKYETYCEKFVKTQCSLQQGCQWEINKCSHFTGCTAFPKITDSECQEISNNCITDGVHCVEKNSCSSYLNQLTCKIDNNGKPCYWDISVSPDVCVNAEKCNQLPFYFMTDEQCRSFIPTCTVKLDGGCIDSGVNCSDQEYEIQCIWNKSQTQACFWNGISCVDRICSNAPQLYKTDDVCSTFLSTCTTKQDGGCAIRSSCSDAKILKACLTNNLGGECYWIASEQRCADKNCDAAPQNYRTNKQCKEFLSDCILKQGGGCQLIEACTSINTQEACVQNSTGDPCFWKNNQCFDKICINAPSTNNTHELCNQFLSSCTVNATNNGCTAKTCYNAPIEYDTNETCNDYLSGCITKAGGGCIINTTCYAIDLEKACVKDAVGNACIFDITCKDKICVNAPISNDSHTKCQAYMSNCTVNSSLNGCVEMSCENIQTSENCLKDKNNNKCIWKKQCYQKRCKQAPQSMTTYGNCQDFMTTCTVDNVGYGCMDKPPICSGILSQAGCVSTINGVACEWSSNKCQQKTCFTASSYLSTTSDCNTYQTGCIVNNTQNGCLDPTVTPCSARALEDNCNVSTGPVCLWDPTSTPQCILKSCQTASQTSITTVNGFISVTFSNSSCSSYLTGCIVNNDSTGCIAKAASCSPYSSTNCSQGLANGNVCFWNAADSTCVDKQCQLIKKASHNDCQTAYDSCTYGNGTVCAAKQASCGGYTQNQCHTTSSGKNCVWANNACRDAICTDATNSGTFNTHFECNTFASTCTVIDRVDNLGCVSLAANCTDYTSEAQCVIDQSRRDCFWNYDVCILASVITQCSDIKGPFSFSDGYCNGKRNVCKNIADNTACELMACDEFTTAASYTMTAEACVGYNSTCTLNRAGYACITRVATCAAAFDQSCTTADDGVCTWTTSGSGSCAKTVAAATDPCAAHTGTDLSATDCSTFQAACTVNLSGTACVTKQATCAGYLAQGDCRTSTAGNCKWDPTCVDVEATIDCSKIVAESGLTYAICQTFDATCTVNSDGTACVTIDTCSTLNTGPKCYHGSDGRCFWDGTSTCTAIAANTDCATVTGTNLTTAICQGYNSVCNVNKAGTACQENKACSVYDSDGECSYSDTTKCFYITDTSTCTAITTASTDCQKVTGSSLTNDICKSYNSSCVPNLAQTACQEGKATCNYYQQNTACSYAGSTRCVWYSNACTSVASSYDCGKVTGSSLTYDACQSYNSACAVNGAGTVCEAKSCSNKPSAGGYTDSACKNYLSTCTANSTSYATACTITLPSCSLYTAENTCRRTVEDECVWVVAAAGVTPAGFCVKKTCSTAAIGSIFDTHDECNAYLNTCTVAKIGGCVSTGPCYFYKSKTQCEANSCFWNSRLFYGCVNKSCDQVEAAYNTHELCQGTGIGCTVRTNYQGCMALAQSCSAYTIQDQCHLTSNHKTCVWIVSDFGSSCQQMSCLTANATFNTHQLCYSYFADEGKTDADMCTVAVIDVNGTPTPSGCQQVGPCDTYKYEINCQIDNEGKDCVWNINKELCEAKSCYTADVSYDNDDKCRGYLSDQYCTLDSSGSGCMIKPDKCEAMTQAQCNINSVGKNCEWFQDKCVDKTCETAPETVTDGAGCNNYQYNCTMESFKCKTQICEDFDLTTDIECENAKAGCTSNGSYCVTRSVCAAAFKAGCVTQSDGKQCQWIEQLSYCVLKNCATAPATDDYITDAQCAAYLPGCTTKQGKGCTTKTTCSSANIDKACTTSYNGMKCVWDIDKCRNIDCQDYAGSTYAECQAKGSNCTAGINGKCIQLSKCEDVVTRAACVYGLNGPCLWVSKFNNGAGACISYTSCKSAAWTSDSQCKMISDQCTTNGTNCLAITSCADTNTQGGCKTGYDGDCIQTVTSLGSKDPAVCKIYSACTEAYYLTHNECQTANSKCTTNGITQCVSLSSCSSYLIEEACKINDNAGPTVDSTTGAITLTGICKWDTETLNCRDQICSDLAGLTHNDCSSQLSACTSDGAKCITKSTCASFTTQVACEIVYSTDGPQGKCIWEVASTGNNNVANCRIMKCSDIQNGTTTQVCSASLSLCISDGTVCIAQNKCSTYKTLTSCNSKGIDGICVFTASILGGTCALMSSCQMANNDSNACSQAKDRCSWTPTTSNKCVIHTCASFAATNPTLGCTAFFSWDRQTQQICSYLNGKCVETDPSTLSPDSCYLISQYTYTWNQSTNKCNQCINEAILNNSTSTNTTNETNKTVPQTNYDILIKYSWMFTALII